MTTPRPATRPARPPGADPLLTGAVLLLTALGAVMVYSASAVTAEARVHDQFWYLRRQLLAAGVGVALLVAVVRIGYRRLERLAGVFLLATALALVLVMVPGLGRTAGGARRWLDLGPLAFQPAEAAKVALVLWLARSLARKGEAVRLFSVGFLPHAAVTAALVLLVLAQRDLGTAVILVLLLFVMLFAAGTRLGTLLGAALVAAPLAWKLVSGTPYRMQRIAAFLDPWRHREGVGFQIVESLIGIGNGGWLGQGLGQGKGKLFYLPAAHTDFIAAVIAEETGLLGVTLVLSLYALVAWRGLKAALDAADGFGAFAAVGMTTLIASQALVNLAVVFGLLPTKGLTLPFVSYGGSSLVTLLAGAGVLASVSAGRGGFLRGGSQAVRLSGAAPRREAA